MRLIPCWNTATIEALNMAATASGSRTHSAAICSKEKSAPKMLYKNRKSA